jgi:hypothetical protein
MTTTQLLSRKPLASELVALSDAELDSYLQELSSRSDTPVVSVADPKNLPPSFIQRLRQVVTSHPSRSSEAGA